MKTVFKNFLSALPKGAFVLVLLYALGYPIALVGQFTHKFELYDWLALSPPLLWRGEAWCALTYAFLPGSIVDWVVSLFWLATLVGVLSRNWSGRELWTYSLGTTVAGALVVAVAKPGMQVAVVGNGAMIFGLLAAWYRLYGRERLILLGIGEMSVRQAAIIVGFIEALVLFFCVGWFVTLAMMCGGAAGWGYLVIRGKTAMNRRSRIVESQRVARLEL
jgi:membrane associated rhomboid family serine protease